MLTYEDHKIVIHSRKKPNIQVNTSSIAKDHRYNSRLLTLPQNDTGNAKRILLFCRDVIKYNQEISEWMIWNGKYWSNDNALPEIYLLAQAVMEKYYTAAKENVEADDKTRQAIINHAKQSNNAGSLSNMISLLKNMNYVHSMSCKNYYLNVQNGVVNLKTKELMPHSPDYGCTNICSCNYNPDAKSIHFKNFVNQITDNNEEIYKYLHIAAGYWICGTHKEEKFFILKGNGANGKSKFLEAIERTVGNYASIFPISAITKSHSYAGQPTPELVPMVNKRFTYTSELKANDVINDSVIKQLTGGEKFMFRKMRKEYSEAKINFKIVMDTNYAPNFKTFDYAIKRRLVIIPFYKTFEGDKRDNDLPEKLKADREYILKWLVNGAYLYYKDGLHEPLEVISYMQEFYRSSDSLGSFIEHVLETVSGNDERSSVIYERYLAFCGENGFDPIDIKTFSQGLCSRGLKKKIKNSGTYFKDIKLK